MTLASDHRVVVYSGDDERNEYVYKFVGAGRYDPPTDRRTSGSSSRARSTRPGSTRTAPGSGSR